MLAFVGAAALALGLVGLVLDIHNFDRTRGGYEPPYSGYTGRPIDWSLLDTSGTGLVRRGRVVNVLIDCRSGMISLEWFRLEVPLRPLSPRALAIHRPQDACRERGFEPGFGH